MSVELTGRFKYYNSFNTGTGSEFAGDPFDDSADSINTNGYGAEAAIALTPTLSIGGRVGYWQATAPEHNSDNDTIFIRTIRTTLTF